MSRKILGSDSWQLAQRIGKMQKLFEFEEETVMSQLPIEIEFRPWGFLRKDGYDKKGYDKDGYRWV